MQFDIIII